MWLLHLAGFLICLPLFLITQGQAFKRRFHEHRFASFLLGLLAAVSFLFLAVEIWKTYKSYWAAPPPQASGPPVDEHFERAVELAKSGRNADAIRAFGAVIQAEPQNVEAYVRRGRAYEALGLDDRAIRDFEIALNISPGLSEVEAEKQRIIARRESEALAPLWEDIAARESADAVAGNSVD